MILCCVLIGGEQHAAHVTGDSWTAYSDIRLKLKWLKSPDTAKHVTALARCIETRERGLGFYYYLEYFEL